MEVGLIVFLVGCLTFAAGQDGLVTAQQWIDIIAKCSDLDISGLETVALDSDCRAYSACPSQKFIRPLVQFCSPGTLYDQTNKICNFADQVDCTGRTILDPCAGQLLGFVEDVIRRQPEQGAGLLCNDGKTVANFQCPPCHNFVQTETGCAPIPGCNVNDTILNVCNLEAVASNPDQYVAIGVETRTLMSCNTGLVFNQELCLCE